MDYCRKQRLIFLMPSATPVDKRARKFAILRNLKGGRFLDTIGLGRFLWLYVGVPSQDDKFSFSLVCPYAYFNTYDTTAIPGPYQDALALLLQRFQSRVSVDREAVDKATNEMTERLEGGETIPGLRRW